MTTEELHRLCMDSYNKGFKDGIEVLKESLEKVLNSIDDKFLNSIDNK